MRRLKVTLVHSWIDRPERQRRTLYALGLRRVGSFRLLPDNPQVRGMVRRVRHLVRVEEV